MQLAIVVDGLNLLVALRRYHRGEINLGAALRGLRGYFGAPDRAIFFAELTESVTTARLNLVRSEQFEVRIADRAVESAITAEMVELSHDHDHVVLVSGDADFAPAIQVLVGRGTRVTVVAAQPMLATGLRAGTSVVELAEVISASEHPDMPRLHRPELSPDDAAFIRALPPDQIITLRAVSAGIRMEEHLKFLCVSRNLPLPTAATISQVNDVLLKGGVYGKVLHRKVALWGAIRNEAAHAGERAFSRVDLQQMEAGIDALIRQNRA